MFKMQTDTIVSEKLSQQVKTKYSEKNEFKV